ACCQRQGSFRSSGHALGSAVGTLTPGTIGRMTLDGMLGENAIDSLAVLPNAGCGWWNDQIGWVPLSAVIVSLMREPFRYACPSKYRGMTPGTNSFSGIGCRSDASLVGIGSSSVGVCLKMLFASVASLRSLARIQPFWT